MMCWAATGTVTFMSGNTGSSVTIPAGTKLKAHGFYLLGLSASGLANSVTPGASTINVSTTTGFETGQKIDIDGESRSIASVGTPATAMTTLFIPVSTGPWLTFPTGSTNLPVASAAGFAVGQKLGFDLGGNYESATVTAVGKAATQTTLSAAAAAGATTIRVAAVANISVGDTLTVGTDGRKELVTVTRVGTPVAGGDAAPGAGGRGGDRGRARRQHDADGVAFFRAARQGMTQRQRGPHDFVISQNTFVEIDQDHLPPGYISGARPIAPGTSVEDANSYADGFWDNTVDG